MEDRILPHSLPAEEAVIAAILKDPDCLERVSRILGPASLYMEAHRVVFSAASDLNSRGCEVDIVAVADELQRRGDLELLGGMEYLRAMAESIADSSSVDAHAGIIREKEKLRQLIASSREIIAAAMSEESSDDIINKAEDKIFQMTEMRSRGKIEIYGPGQIAARRLQGLIDRSKRGKISSGYASLDDVLVDPWAPGDMTTIAGVPKAGKSTLKTNLAMNWISTGKRVVFFSLEQLFDGEADRNDAVISGISLAGLKDWGNWDADDPRRALLHRTNQWYDEECQLFHVPTRFLSLAESYGVLRKIKKDYGPIDFAVYDLFDRLSDVNVANERVAKTTVGISDAMAMSADIGCHIVSLVQLNDPNADSKKPRKPVPADMKWCKAYIEHSSLVLLIDRPSLRDATMANDFMDVIVGLQRNGRTGDEIRFVIDGETLKLKENEEFFNEERDEKVPVIRGGSEESDPTS